MAIKLRQKNKCKIHPPLWLDLEVLKERLKKEKENLDSLEPLHYYFYEIVQILSVKAYQDIPNIELIKNTCADIFSVRNDKINKFLETIKQYKFFFKINNLLSRELELIRPLVTEILKTSDEFFNMKNDE